MEMTSRLARAIPKATWLCRQCRQASNQSDARYSTQTATAGLAGDFLRSLQSNTSPRSRQPVPSSQSRQPVKSSTPTMPRRSTPPRMYDISEARARNSQEEIDPSQPQYTGKELERMMTRKFMAGDVYSPHDLTGVEQMKWAQRRQIPRTKIDVVDRLGVDFMREYKNISLMQEFVTSNGRILPATKTGLKPVNQRKMAKAVRRASGIGLIPKTYKHPELMKRTRGF